MNKKTELNVADPKLHVNKKLPNFYHSQSSNGDFCHDHPKKVIVSCILKPLIIL